MEQFALDRHVFEQLRKIVYEKSGISLSDGKMALVSARIAKRLRALGLDSCREYLEVLQNDEDGSETVHFLDVISTNTTSFYREPDHFELFGELLAKWAVAGQRRFRIWCAASSSGEEPYTIAMVAREKLPGDEFDVKILATDISTRILAKAMDGVYDAEKIKLIPAYLAHKYFVKEKVKDAAPAWRASDSLKSLISFRRLNLSTPPFPMHGPMDVIFCRNVMIYFDNAVRQRLVQEMARLLKPGGYLMVGHSESLSSIKCPLKTVQPAVYVKS